MRIRSYIYFFITMTAIFVTGIFIGAFAGINWYLESRGAIESAILVKELSSLRGGNTEILIAVKESELDSYILVNKLFRESEVYNLFGIGIDNEKKYYSHMKMVAEYRNKYPSIPIRSDYGVVGKYNIDEANVAVENEIQYIIKKYGK